MSIYFTVIYHFVLKAAELLGLSQGHHVKLYFLKLAIVTQFQHECLSYTASGLENI